MGKTFSDMKYSWISTNYGSSQKRCCLYLLQNFAYYFILIVFFGGPTVKPCSNLRFSSGDVFVKKHFLEPHSRGRESATWTVF